MKSVKLEDLCTIVRGASPRPKGDPRYFGGSIPWISIADITAQRGKFLLSTREGVTEAGAKLSRLLKPGTLIVSNSATVCVPKILKYEGCIHDGFVALLDLSADIDRDYLYHYFNAVRSTVRDRNQQGATQVNLNTGIFRDLVVPVPPLKEQQRIAMILDKADALQHSREQARRLADQLLRALFLEQFGDPVGNPKGWPVFELGRLTQICSGSTPSRDEPEHFGGEIHWVTTTEVNGQLIMDTNEKVTPKGVANARLKVFPRDSILVALYGQGKTRGRCALLGIPATTNQACGVLLPNHSFLPLFMLTQLSLGYDRLRALARGGNQPNLNLGLLASFSVLLPPIKYQQSFVARANALARVGSLFECSMRQSSLFQSDLAHAAFQGNL